MSESEITFNLKSSKKGSGTNSEFAMAIPYQIRPRTAPEEDGTLKMLKNEEESKIFYFNTICRRETIENC